MNRLNHVITILQSMRPDMEQLAGGNVEEIQKEAKDKLHEAAMMLSWFESDDYAYSQKDGVETARKLRSAYYQACAEAERAGIDVSAEIKGRGYLL